MMCRNKGIKMSGFFSIIWIAVFFIIIFRLVKRDRSGSSARDLRNKPFEAARKQTPLASSDAVFSQPKPHPSVSAYKPQKAPMGGTSSVYQGGASRSTLRAEKATHTLMENRSSDWLATELREERQALYRTNAMFGQQMEHKQICDARMLKEYHLEHCSADGIDMAEY